ncbi:uroporphyrinogen-III C-methyltransferase [Flexivirga sp. ID2601S]|uniref:uroporphyrinogen-III C-methyltransferase n=1 Tax=Flexivirga aerilata TaxID=1656889 RepID=A0A849AJ26_9MICO|nr:uroporphyrinogen-III C-methyltransferase [Flexivirga aerilata]NNG40435.1 uroporphyrinogen-III C-methyltransferase [Flexivirga aerilata]
MSELKVAGRTVLLHSPGLRIAESVHALVAAGATVAVLLDTPHPTVADLADRGLVTVVEGPLDGEQLAAYDVVMRDRVADEPSSRPAGRRGEVVLVGGGPGAEGLLTLDAVRAIETADVVLTDRLAPVAVLDRLRPDVEVIHVGKIPRGESTPQETINRLLVEHARAGRRVVRLKGGDSFVFGRGGEEWIACADAGIAVRVVPGVSSALAAPALAGIPLTHRSLTQGFTVVSGHVAPDDPRSDVDWAALARSGLTLVILMGVATLDAVARALIDAGRSPDTPAATIENAAINGQRTVRARLDAIAKTVQSEGVRAPAITVIGDVVDALPETAQ